MFWPNWRSASGVAASSATTTCSAGLADALDADDAPAQVRMHQRWPIVMVDEFQDTDPVQWQVIDRAFTGRSTLILIGDPKQAIYAFRGGDIVTYLDARCDRGCAEDARHELAQRRRLGAIGCRWCSRAPNSGDRGSSSTRSTRTTPAPGCAGAPSSDPFRLRVVRRETLRPQRNSAVADRPICARTYPPTWPPTSATC